MQDYEKRLNIPIIGNNYTNFYTKSGDKLSTCGYTRVVIGGRGPYVEFDELDYEALRIPRDQEWRLSSYKAYYVEFRSFSCDVKVYWQLREVDYADYIVGKYYISPFDLDTDDGPVIDKDIVKGVLNAIKKEINN